MSLPAVLPISLQQLYDEFGIVPPSHPGLTAFVRGGTYVDINTPGGTIPTAPPIKLTDFLGARHIAQLSIAAAVATGDYTLSSITSDGGLANVNFTLTGSKSTPHSPSVLLGTFRLDVLISFVDTLQSVSLALPPGLPSPPGAPPGWTTTYLAGYHIGAAYMTATPGGGLAFPVTIPNDGRPPTIAEGSPGQFQSNLLFTPPVPNGQPGATRNLPLTGSVVSLLVQVQHSTAGTSGAKSVRTNGASGLTTITFPVQLTIMDARGVNATKVINLNLTLDSTAGFTAP